MNKNSQKAVRQLKALEKLIQDKKMRLAADWDEPWQVLIATILSAVTKDEMTIEVCEELFKKYPSPSLLGRASISFLKKIIRKVNYHKTKAKHIKKTCQIIAVKGILKNLEGLIELPGVGRKVGNVYLAVAHKANAIGVDTHVAYISQFLGWTKHHNTERIERDLEALFPRRHWRKLNRICVHFGKTYTSRRKKDALLLTLHTLNE